MLFNRFILIGLSCLLLTGCVTTSGYLPKNYKGSTAVLADSSANFIGASFLLPAKVDFFYAQEINNQRIDNAQQKTQTRYAGLGYWFKPQSHQRRIPAKTITVKIVGRTHHGAPIGVILRENYSVSGTVKFRPVPGRRYVVRGRLSKGKSSVWIQTTGGRVVGRRILAKK